MTTTASSLQPAGPDPYGPEALLDPYPHYAALRRLARVAFQPDYGVWLVPGYAECVQVLRNHGEFVSGDGVAYGPRGDRERYPLLESDPPLHNRLRRAVQPLFARGRIEELRAGVEAAAVAIADEAVSLGEFDAVKVVAEPLPDRAIELLTGLRPPSVEALVAWSDATVRAQEPGAAPEHTARLGEALTWLVTDGVPTLPEHSLGWIITRLGGVNGGLEEGPERVMTLASIWLAGIDSTGALLGNAIDAFVENPDQWDLLRARPDLIPNAVEELLRFEAPFRIFYRRTRVDTELAGVTIPAGATVGAMLGSAGRDPDRFPDPDRLDLTRDNARSHLAFGTSIHLCLGQPLARMEVAAMLTELTRRVQRFERSGDAVRSPSKTMRKFDSLPVRAIPTEGAK